MRSAYENNKKIIRSVKPSMEYDGGSVDIWKARAKEKLSLLLGMDKYKKTDPELNVEYEKKRAHVTELRFSFQSHRE